MAVSLSIIEAGTIGDYSDLTAKVAAWMDRDDLTPRMPDFVALLEARLNRVLRTLNMETRALMVASAESTDFPDDFRMLREIHIEGTPDRPLKAMSPDAIAEQYNGASGTPSAFTVSGRTLTLVPPPSGEVTLSYLYYRRIPPLTASAPQNWLLTEHPDIYVWGAIKEAAAYIRDTDALGYASSRLDEAIDELKTASNRDKWGAAPLVPNGIRQVRGARC